MLNQVHLADCMEGMKLLPDAAVDMILCDLPYGTTQNKWDSVIPLERLWEQYRRVIKLNGAIVLTASQPFTSEVIMSNRKDFRHAWVWHKPNVTGHLNAHRIPMKCHEDVLVFCSGRHQYHPQNLKPYNRLKRRGHNGSNFGVSGSENFQEFTNYPRSIISTQAERGNFHPTQKLVALFEYLIRTYTNPGEVVLDNCMGSGTTAVACINSGRNYIGFERDPEYHAKAIARIDHHRATLHSAA